MNESSLDERTKSELDIIETTKRLFSEIIPTFAKKLDEGLRTINHCSSFLFCSLFFFCFFVFFLLSFGFFVTFFFFLFLFSSFCLIWLRLVGVKADFNLSVELHRAGINLRLLGLVRSFSKLRSVRNLILIEMIARTAKEAMKLKLRNKTMYSPPFFPFRYGFSSLPVFSFSLASRFLILVFFFFFSFFVFFSFLAFCSFLYLSFFSTTPNVDLGIFDKLETDLIH